MGLSKSEKNEIFRFLIHMLSPFSLISQESLDLLSNDFVVNKLSTKSGCARKELSDDFRRKLKKNLRIST